MGSVIKDHLILLFNDIGLRCFSSDDQSGSNWIFIDRPRAKLDPDDVDQLIAEIELTDHHANVITISSLSEQLRRHGGHFSVAYSDPSFFDKVVGLIKDHSGKV